MTPPSDLPYVLQILGDAKYGGSTYLALAWTRFLVEQGCRVAVQTTDPQTIAAMRAIPGVSVITTIHIPREVAPGADLRALAALIGLIRRERYTLVQTGMTTAGFVGRLAAWLARAPVIIQDAQGWPVTEHSSLGERIVYTPLSYLAGLLSTRVVCAGHGTARLAEQLHTCPRRRLAVIPNGIDPTPFLDPGRTAQGRALRRELGLADDCLVIGNANRLAPQKDNATLIRAMAALAALLPERQATLLLAGDGPERPQLERLVAELGLGAQVRLLGFRRDIPALLAAIDIFANTSLWEGLSISLLEAMAAARPIITTAILPNAELISHEQTGLLTPPRDPAQVAAAIARFARDPALAASCAAAARRRALEHYTISRRIEQLWQLYLELHRAYQHRAESLPAPV